MDPRIDLKDSEDNWETEMGGSIPGERVVVRGKDLFSELKDYSWQKLLMFIITGRELPENELEVLDKVWSLTVSYPDPRVWNNRIAALAGTVRSTGSLGLSAAMAVTEAKIYGGQANIAAIDFILECAQRVDQGERLEDIIKSELKINRAIYGYGRPVTNNDERIEPMKKVIKQNGMADGKHVLLAYKIEEILKAGRWRFQMNVTGLSAALGADMGLSVQEYYLWQINGFNAGTLACFADASSKQEGTLFPLRCDRINYTGLEKRTWK